MYLSEPGQDQTFGLLPELPVAHRGTVCHDSSVPSHLYPCARALGVCSILFPSSGGNSLPVVAKLSSGEPGVVGTSLVVSTSPLTLSQGLEQFGITAGLESSSFIFGFSECRKARSGVRSRSTHLRKTETDVGEQTLQLRCSRGLLGVNLFRPCDCRRSVAKPRIRVNGDSTGDSLDPGHIIAIKTPTSLNQPPAPLLHLKTPTSLNQPPAPLLHLQIASQSARGSKSHSLDGQQGNSA